MPSRASVVVLASALAVAACGAEANRGGTRSEARRCAEPFPAAEWRKVNKRHLDTEAADRARLELARQLVRCRSLDGLDRAGVRRLLGRPSGAGGDYMEYFLAPEPGDAPLDQIWLFIDIDDGRVGRYDVGQG
jgi:hypothetical protein